MHVFVRGGLVAAGLVLAMVRGTDGAEAVTAGTESRSALALTIYGNGLGLVRDGRDVALAAGDTRVVLADVSRQIVPTSVMLAANGVSVVSVDYRYDLLTPEALLRGSLGETVEVVRSHPTTGEDSVETATVLAVEGGVVLRYRDRVETGVPGRLVFPRVPDGLTPLPTLAATVNAAAAGRREMVLTYLTGGLRWEADYTVVIDDGDDRLDLAARATVVNETGSRFDNAAVGLIAGHVNRLSAPGGGARARMMAEDAAPMAAAAPLPEREAVADLHLYRIARPVSLADRESRQFALFTSSALPYRREYVSESGVFPAPARGEAARRDHPRIVVRIDNIEKGGPGVPMPAGIARLYSRDRGGALRFVGEDQARLTPVGSALTLSPGRAFDIIVERQATDFVRSATTKGLSEASQRIAVKNAKDQAVTVKVVEIIPGDWAIVNESAPHKKEAADRLLWTVDVPANGSSVVTYRVRMQQ